MKHVLVVDDDPDILEYLSKELLDSGYKTGTASDGVQAVLSILENEWHAVIMDIRMPKLDGIGALQIIRRVAPHLPVIMNTGQADQIDVLETKRLGAYTCLFKPIIPDHMFRVLEQALN